MTLLMELWPGQLPRPPGHRGWVSLTPADWVALASPSGCEWGAPEGLKTSPLYSVMVLPGGDSFCDLHEGPPPLCQVTLGHGGRGITLKAWVSGPEKGDHATGAPGTERTPGDPAPGWAPCRGPAVSNDRSLCRALIWITLCRKVMSIESRCSRGAGLSARITGTVAGPWDEPWTRLDCDGEPGPASSNM